MEERFTIFETVRDEAKILSYYVLKKQAHSLSRNFSFAFSAEISETFLIFLLRYLHKVKLQPQYFYTVLEAVGGR